MSYYTRQGGCCPLCNLPMDDPDSLIFNAEVRDGSLVPIAEHKTCLTEKLEGENHAPHDT